MNYILTLLLTFTLLLAACSKSEKQESTEHASAPVVQESTRSDPSTLQIEPSMLRDLRITTTTVEVRSGAESAAILGELRPDEGEYAEIGAPIPSRVVKVNVAPGRMVSAGEVLAVLQSSEVGKARAEAVSAQAK